MAGKGLANVRIVMAGLVVAGWLGCSSTDPKPAASAGRDGSAGAGGADSGGVGGTGMGTGGSGGAAGGAGGSGGSAGSGGAVDAAGGSADGAIAGDVPVEGPIAPGTRGVQSDPGAMGDGTSDQMVPFTAPPETLMRIGGAPTGVVSGMGAPLLYNSTTVYAGLRFQYWIYVPAQYRPGKRAALMVLLDGHHYLSLPSSLAKFNAPITFDNLIHSGDMPVTIALFINPGTADGSFVSPDDSAVRATQYDTPSDRFSRFLLQEILPDLMLTKYDIVEDPEGWSIVGHSSGGICAFMVGWYQPDKFRKLLTHNASFPNTNGMFPRLVRDLATAKPLRVNLLSSPLDLGRNADGSGESSFFRGNNDAAAALMMRGYHYRYRIGRGSAIPPNPTPDQIRRGDHYPPDQAVADHPAALRWMWRGYKLPWYP